MRTGPTSRRDMVWDVVYGPGDELRDMKYHAAESFSGTSTYTRPTYHETRWPEWGLNFSYDGFGNLTSEVPVKGAAPTAYFSYEPATNRLTGSGYAYDANGNLTAAPLV